jgi:hypothetical protein
MKLSFWLSSVLGVGVVLAQKGPRDLAARDINSTGSVLVTENATTTLANGSSVANPAAFATTISLNIQRIYNICSIFPASTNFSRILGSVRWPCRYSHHQYDSRRNTSSYQ